MQTLAEIVLSNAAIATLLALVAALASRFCRRPPVVYALWLLVLVKLVTPPVFRVPLALVPQGDLKTAANAPEQTAADRIHVSENTSASFSVDPADRDEPATAVLSPLASADLPTVIPSSIHPLGFADGSEDFDATGDPAVPFNDQTVARNVDSDEAIAPWYAWAYWPEGLLGVWFLGSMAWFSVAGMRVLRFCREVQRELPTSGELQRCVDALARRFGLSRPPMVKVVSSSVPPMLWALARPAVILVPRMLVERLSPEQQNALLAHELAHYCRRDHWVRWFEVLVLGLYWWFPVAWLARRELQRAEEQCCDAWVLWALPDARHAYAQAILETVDFLAADRRPTPALASGLSPVHFLERRFEMILHARPMRRLTASAQWIVVLVGLVVLPLSATGQVASTEPVQADTPTVEAQLTPPQTSAFAPAAEIAAPAVVAQGAQPAQPVQAANPAIEPVLATSVTVLDTPAQNDIESRLQRLEKMMGSILAELKGRTGATSSNRSLRAAAPGYADTSYRVSRMSAPTKVVWDAAAAQAPSLAALKKQRIDIEEQLLNLQDDLSKLDEQIAKLQNVRKERSERNPLQAK